MQGLIVRTTARDGIALEGMLYTSTNIEMVTAVLHVHGTWGNFYGNPFIDVFGDFYPGSGFAFLSGNTRGHDGGAITERFADSVLDLEAWIEFAKGLGFRRLVLQGHSMGALKAVNYLLSGERSDSIAALILLSPFDVVAFYSSGSEQKREENLRRVRELAKGDPDSLVPKDIFSLWLISAGTFLDLVDHSTAADIFPFRQGTLSGSPIVNIRVPVFAGVGDADFAAHPSPGAQVQQLQGLSNVHAVLVPGAPHNFAGREGVLTEAISRWRRDLSL